MRERISRDATGFGVHLAGLARRSSPLKAITDKPVPFLINTHLHYDHANGNQAFGPAVDIIGHEFTRRKLTGDILEKGMFADLLKGMPKQLDDLKARAVGEADAAVKTRLEQQVRVQDAFANSLKDLKVTPPNGPCVNLLAVSRMYEVMEHRADQ